MNQTLAPSCPSYRDLPDISGTPIKMHGVYNTAWRYHLKRFRVIVPFQLQSAQHPHASPFTFIRCEQDRLRSGREPLGNQRDAKQVGYVPRDLGGRRRERIFAPRRTATPTPRATRQRPRGARAEERSPSPEKEERRRCTARRKRLGSATTGERQGPPAQRAEGGGADA